MIKRIIAIILLLTVAPVILTYLITGCMWVFDNLCNFIVIPTIEFVLRLFKK